jgi:starch phosphorylase
MTVLALRLSGFANGVSQLHGDVSRAMWRFLWPELPTDEVPIGAITNGVHTQTWLTPELKQLYSTYLGAGWEEHIEENGTWDGIQDIPDQELWAVHQQRKVKMINFVRKRVRQQYLRHGESTQRIEQANQILNPQALTIGFARRFATYKRAMLVFHDMERITRILNNPDRPVQIIFSGKAHPDDEPGKALIQQVYELSQSPEFVGKIVFLENYDINIARHLISGVDLWMNTPRRPREASGTSGQKAALSGVPNFSILDGWWEEGYNGENGWAIGENREYKDLETQDDADAYSLYQTLEGEIIPAFFERDAVTGVPGHWIKVMKSAIRSCAPRYSMRRMVIEYTERYYLPAAEQGALYQANAWALAKEIVAWRSAIRHHWQGVRVELDNLPRQTVTVGDPVPIQAKVWLDGVAPSDIVVELVTGMARGDNDLKQPVTMPMAQVGQDGNALIYEAAFTPGRSGPMAVAVRARPDRPHYMLPMDPSIRWA